MHSSNIFYYDEAYWYVHSVLLRYGHSSAIERMSDKVDEAWKDAGFEDTDSLIFYDDIEDETIVIVLADTSVLISTFNGLPDEGIKLCIHVAICHLH